MEQFSVWKNLWLCGTHGCQWIMLIRTTTSPSINCDTTFVHMDSLGSFMHIVIFHELKTSPWCPSDLVTLDTLEMGTSGNTCTNNTLELHVDLYGDELSHPSSSIDCKYMYSCLVFVFQRESHTKVFHRLTFYRPLKVLRLHLRLLVWIFEDIPGFLQVLF